MNKVRPEHSSIRWTVLNSDPTMPTRREGSVWANHLYLVTRFRSILYESRGGSHKNSRYPVQSRSWGRHYSQTAVCTAERRLISKGMCSICTAQTSASIFNICIDFWIKYHVQLKFIDPLDTKSSKNSNRSSKVVDYYHSLNHSLVLKPLSNASASDGQSYLWGTSATRKRRSPTADVHENLWNTQISNVVWKKWTMEGKVRCESLHIHITLSLVSKCF